MLKKVCFYIEYLPEYELAGRVFMELWLQGIEAQRLPVADAWDLETMPDPEKMSGPEKMSDQEKMPDTETMPHPEDMAGQEEDRTGCGPEDMLVVTDLPKLASFYIQKGCAVLGYLHEKNRDASFEGVRYLIEDFSGMDAEYCKMVYARAHGIPLRILETKRCIVREICEDDLDRLYEIYEDPRITAYMEPLFEDRQEELEYIRNYIAQVYAFYGYGMWIVVEKESGRIIGRAGIEQKEEYAELGYLIAAERQSMGYAQEVCRAVLSYAFDELDIREIRASVHRENAASLNVCRKIGLQETGQNGDFILFSAGKR